MVRTSFIGKAGELAARSEFLLHGYNVAAPDVDVGDDIFVVEDRRGKVWRIQVKTATVKRTRRGHRGQFSVPVRQLLAPTRLPLVFVFAFRVSFGKWEFVIVPRRALVGEYRSHGVGTRNGDQLQLYFSLTPSDVTCSQRSLQRYRNRCDLSAYR
jgi:hypothetical protein